MTDYIKPILTVDQQISLFHSRGLIISKTKKVVWYLKNVGYYRISIYAKAYQNSDDSFQKDVTFDHLVELYEFDKKLRSLCVEYLEIIENSFKSALIREIGELDGSFYHLNSQLFKDFPRLEKKIKDIVEKNKDHYTVRHYYKTYNAPPYPPIWIILQIASFGEAVSIYKCLNPQYQMQISSVSQLYFLVYENRMRCLAHMRNICAHHDRLWNKTMTGKLKVSNNNYTSFFQDADSFFSYAIVIVVLLKHANSKPKNFIKKLEVLLKKHSHVQISHMRMSSNWKEVLLRVVAL